MEAEQKTREYFVPAELLEHPSNPESATLKSKIVLAIRRLEIGEKTAPVSVPFIIIKTYQFNKERMGYDVQAIVKP